MEKFLEGVKNSTLNAFSQMLSLPASAGGFQEIKDPFVCDFSGSMGIAGTVSGAINIHFNEDVAYRIIAKMTMMEEGDITPDDIKDAVGEIINLVAGGAKTELAGAGINFNISLPIVIQGKGHSTQAPANSAVTIIPFQTELGYFYIETIVKK